MSGIGCRLTLYRRLIFHFPIPIYTFSIPIRRPAGSPTVGRKRREEKRREGIEEWWRNSLKHTCVPASSAGHRAAHSDVGGNMQLDGFPGCLFYFYTQQHKPSHRSALDHRCRSLLTLSRRPSCLCLVSRGPLLSTVVHGYIHENAPTRLVPSRGRQLGADTGAITSLLLGEDRRIAFTTSAQPSDPPQTRAMSESGHQLAAK